MPKRKKENNQSEHEIKTTAWESFMWKPVADESEEHFEGEDDGGYDDSMFFGLEEIDGNSYKIKKNKRGSMHLIMKSNKKQKTEDNRS